MVQDCTPEELADATRVRDEAKANYESWVIKKEESDAKLEAELASDREAVVSEIYWEQKKMGELLSTPEGAPSPLFRVAQLEVVAYVGLATLWPSALAAKRPSLSGFPARSRPSDPRPRCACSPAPQPAASCADACVCGCAGRSPDTLRSKRSSRPRGLTRC